MRHCRPAIADEASRPVVTNEASRPVVHDEASRTSEDAAEQLQETLTAEVRSVVTG
jgi:hypothetical protein